MVNGLTVNPGCLTLACADLDARPLFWTDEEGKRFGYEPAIAEAVAGNLGLKLRWLFLQWSEFGPAVLRGEADAIWCGSAITPERQKTFLYSRPYAIFHESVLVRRGSGIRSPDDLSGLKVGAISGCTNMALAENWKNVSRVGFDGSSDDVFSDMIGALRAGSIDAVVDDEPAFGGLLESDEFEIAFTVETANCWGAAFKPTSIQLVQAMNRALESIEKSGQLHTIWQHWLPAINFPEMA